MYFSNSAYLMGISSRQHVSLNSTIHANMFKIFEERPKKWQRIWCTFLQLNIFYIFQAVICLCFNIIFHGTHWFHQKKNQKMLQHEQIKTSQTLASKKQYILTM